MKNYKKIISAILCAAMVMGIASCGSTDETRKHRDDSRETEAYKHEGEETVSEITDIENSETEPGETSERPVASAPVTTFETDGNFDPDFTFSTTDRVGNEWN